MIKGFKMKPYQGMEAEYDKRHNALCPEIKDMVREYGGKNYTIFLDKETLTLLGTSKLKSRSFGQSPPTPKSAKNGRRI